MLRRMGAGLLCCLALGACEIDSRDVVASSSLLPGASGAGAAGGLVVQPASVAYGPITMGFAASAHFFVENAGASQLPAPVFWIDGEGASAFTITQNDCTAPLGGGAHCAVALAFRPNDLGARQATLAVAGSEGRIDVALSGSGLEPGGLLLQAAPGSDKSFGNVPLLGEQEATLRLSNPMDLEAGSVELFSNNTAFALVPAQGSECASSGVRLAGGQSCDFRVRFKPALRGVTDGTITARSLAAGSVSLGVSGNALSPARLLVDPARLDFGDVVVAGAAVLDLTVANGGDEPLPPVTGAISGGSGGAFQVSANDCSASLVARESCSISVSFSPAEPGPHAGVLELNAGGAGSLRIDLSGAGLTAGNLLVAAVNGDSGDFGSVVLGSQEQQLFRVSNAAGGVSGPLNLTVNSDEFAIAAASGAECVSGVTNLGAGASCDVRVSFAPAQRRQRNATLTVASSVGGAALNLSGVGLAPAVLETDGPLDFGGVAQRSTTTRSVRVTNSGDELLTAVSASLSGPDAASFAVQQNGCATGVGALGPCSIALAFTPTTSGAHLATLALAGAPSGARDVALTGLGLEAGALQLTPSAGGSTRFGDGVSTDGTQSETRTFILSNTGQASSGTISILPLSGSFRVSTPAGADCVSNSTRLEPGATCTIRVVFAPIARGNNSATLSVTSVDAGSASLALSGIGVSPALLDVQPLQLAFDAPVLVGQSARAALTVLNQGDAPTGLIDTNVTSTPPGFSVSPGTCTGVLAAAESCVLEIVFAPSASGPHGGSARVFSTPGGGVNVSLGGTGSTPAALALTARDSTSFGAVGTSDTATRLFTLSNTGGQSAGTLRGITLGPGFSLAPPLAGDCVPNVTGLGAGASCGFGVAFQPNASGNFAVTMIATSSLGQSASLALTGQGLTPPILTGSATSLSFVTSVFVGNQNSETLTWTIGNAGGSSTQPLAFSNSNPEEIRSFPQQCTNLRLGPGMECPITMQLAPLFPGQRMATFTVTAGDQSVSVLVTGVGTN